MAVALTVWAALLGLSPPAAGHPLRAPSLPSTTATLEPSQAAHEHHGFGGLSAGASSRLLWDYEPSVRDEILDLLFAPKQGAGLTINKVEIGGSVPSTDGAEPAIAPNGPGDYDCSRIAYEGWLVAEAEKRNPAVKHYGLSWGVPFWIGNGSYYSDDNVDFHIRWMQCVRNATGVSVDYLGVWNERPVGTDGLDWAVRLRRALDTAGFADTRIIVPDGHSASQMDELVADILANSTVRAAIWGIGLHYPCYEPNPAVQASGLAFWSSEDYSSDAAQWLTGGEVWGRLLVQNYVLNNFTATVAWATIWSVYDNLVCQHNGLTRAMEPWSGHYSVDTPMYASAHLGQFVQPGWWHLAPGPGAGAGNLTGGGHYMTLVDDRQNPERFVLVLETLQAGGRCRFGPTPSGNQTLSLTLAAGFPRPDPTSGAALWRTTELAGFVLVATGIHAVEQGDGTATLALPAPILPDAMYTLASHPAGQSVPPGSPAPSAPFPKPFQDNFAQPGASGTGNQRMPAYWSDQYGLFERAPADSLAWHQGPRGPRRQTSDARVATSDARVATSDARVATSDARVATSDASLATSDASVAPPPGSSPASAPQVAPSSSSSSSAAVSSSTSSSSAASPTSSSFVLKQVLMHDPLSNGWATNRAPLTIVGSSNWTDYTVRAQTSMQTALLAQAQTAVTLQPCSSSGAPNLAFQVWSNNTPAVKFLENAGTGQCLNIDGCGGVGSGIIVYRCITSSNTCDGPPPPGQKWNTANLEWTLSPTGLLRSVLNSSLCVSAAQADRAARAAAPASMPEGRVRAAALQPVPEDRARSGTPPPDAAARRLRREQHGPTLEAR